MILSAIPIFAALTLYVSATVKIYHIESPDGRYKFKNANEAAEGCRNRGLIIAQWNELELAWEAGYDVCVCGWVREFRAFLPVVKPRAQCADEAGLHECPNPSDWGNEGWNAFCVEGE